MGDPLEVNAAGEFYARKDDHLIVGSVKGNIGWATGFAFLVQPDTNESFVAATSAVTSSLRHSLHHW